MMTQHPSFPAFSPLAADADSPSQIPPDQAKVFSDNLFTPKERQDRPQHEKGSERHRILPTLPPGGEEDKRNDGSAERPEKDGEEGGTPSQERTDHCGQLDVPAPHPSPTENRHEIQDPTTHDDPQERLEGRRGGEGGGGPVTVDQEECREDAPGEADGDPGKGNDVRDDLMLQVYKGHDHQRRDKGPQNAGVPRETEPKNGQGKERSGEELYDRVLPRDPVATAPAFPLEQEEAEQGDVVVGLDGGPTSGTVGAGHDDALPLRDAMDAHITEAPDNESQQETDSDQKRITH